ncbi:hypothetical protein REH76_10650, partial [Photobacterium damselae]
PSYLVALNMWYQESSNGLHLGMKKPTLSGLYEFMLGTETHTTRVGKCHHQEVNKVRFCK